MIGRAAEPVTRPAASYRGISGHRQLRAARHHIPRHPHPEPSRPARRHPREHPRRPGLPRPPPPRARGVNGEQLIASGLPDPGQFRRGQLVLPRRRRARFGIPVLLRVVERVVILRAQPVQPRLPLPGGHRIPVQPGVILIPPGRLLGRRCCHETSRQQDDHRLYIRIISAEGGLPQPKSGEWSLSECIRSMKFKHISETDEANYRASTLGRTMPGRLHRQQRHVQRGA